MFVTFPYFAGLYAFPAFIFHFVDIRFALDVFRGLMQEVLYTFSTSDIGLLERNTTTSGTIIIVYVVF